MLLPDGTKALLAKFAARGAADFCVGGPPPPPPGMAPPPPLLPPLAPPGALLALGEAHQRRREAGAREAGAREALRGRAAAGSAPPGASGPLFLVKTARGRVVLTDLEPLAAPLLAHLAENAARPFRVLAFPPAVAPLVRLGAAVSASLLLCSASLAATGGLALAPAGARRRAAGVVGSAAAAAELAGAFDADPAGAARARAAVERARPAYEALAAAFSGADR